MSARPRPDPPPLYAIADADALGAGRLAAAVAEMAAAGVGWIQLRIKRPANDAELYRLAEGCCRRLEGSAARLWMDDRADVAAALPFAGLHVGQRDLPPAAARRVVGDGVWIGLSTHDRRQLAAAEADPEVDVVALGPIFATTGKERPDPPVGLAALDWARRATAKPLVAIGGIEAGSIGRVLSAGADSAAVLGAVSVDPGVQCRRLLAAAEAHR